MAKILVIEDEDSFRNVLVKMLTKAGFDVQQAGDGNQALEVCAEFRPDLVLTDIIMPDKEGLETIQELLEINPKLKIIAMSGGGRFGPDSYLPLAEKLGAKATLQKPFMREEMIATINSVLLND
ncbi:MAG: response regulator [Candidatus Cloacimonetes bacterium]|jgi:DNA-binding response OmpR family regulator|nr:response regulator [Candidatus Cloacimonadota bacterium]MDY0172392.1 response regulator [Candidatus Cloacimonadaceae bacterium]